MVVTSTEHCESCGKEVDPIEPAKTLEDNFANETRKNLSICTDCFKKRFKVTSKKRSNYGGTIYELVEKQKPRFGFGSSSFSCLKCDWVAWTDVGLAVHMRKKHAD
ncbi:MAG: hypothetical protein ThorAB25_07030 [Candidatus Thorarchaeota archaeon AB_25]|nr:MAG: hypothetical protein ThorAB25_07030 [Candidatus Thorarchaeota archaeon AB_25]